MTMKHIVWGVFIGMWMFAITAAFMTWFIVSQIHANSYFFK